LSADIYRIVFEAVEKSVPVTPAAPMKVFFTKEEVPFMRPIPP